MAQKVTTDGVDEVETYSLEVSKDTVVNGLKINDRPGEQRTVLFRKKMGGGRGEGTLRDVRGLHWDGDSPIQLRPREFVADVPFAGPAETRSEARDIAEEEAADPDEEAEIAMEQWESFVRGQLKDEIVVEPIEPEGTTTIYEIEYVEGDE